MGKIIRRTLTALLIVIFALSAAVVGAKIQMYTATGEDYANEIESQDIAKLRARDKAIKKATKQAGVYLKTYSRSVNSELTDDEVTAITSNAWQLVNEPKYSSKIVKGSDETSIIIWTATVEVNVDDSEIQSWIKRDDKEKSTIITQTREAQKSSEENERKIEDLREKYNRTTSQAEKDSLRKQMTDADRDFLANQKLKEGNKLRYAGDYNGAIKLYNEAIEINPNWEYPYNNRGVAYANQQQYEKSIQDFDKAIELNPNLANVYSNRGFVYDNLGQHEIAIQDFDKAIQANPNYDIAYNNRGWAYTNLKQYKRAIQDFDKAIELNPKFSGAYSNRGVVYSKLEQYKLAIQDFDKAIKLNPFFYNAYYNRGETYRLLKQYKRAIKDFDKAIVLKAIVLNKIFEEAHYGRGIAYLNTEQYEKAITDFDKYIELNPNYAYPYFYRAFSYSFISNFSQAIEDLNKAIELKPNDMRMYRVRGLCYQNLGEEAKAQADFAKAKELGWSG